MRESGETRSGSAGAASTFSARRKQLLACKERFQPCTFSCDLTSFSRRSSTTTSVHRSVP